MTCKYCEDRGHWHRDDNELFPTHVLITYGAPPIFVISQDGLESHTRIKYCPMCGQKL